MAECEHGRPGVRCGFVSLYEGLRYFTIETLEIRDVRIVYAPPESVGDFGGEIDNWRWPRQCGDVAFFRAYVGKDGLPADYAADNVPYQPPAFLKLATTPLAEGDLVMVTGYPGQTSLLAPAVEMKEIQSIIYPEQLAMFDAYLALIARLSLDDPELAIKATGAAAASTTTAPNTRASSKACSALVSWSKSSPSKGRCRLSLPLIRLAQELRQRARRHRRRLCRARKDARSRHGAAT